MSDQQIRFSYNLGADLTEVARDELGCFSLVICPKSCQTQRIEEIETALQVNELGVVDSLDYEQVDGQATTEIFLSQKTYTMTAHELLAFDFGIVVVSYELLVNQLPCNL